MPMQWRTKKKTDQFLTANIFKMALFLPASIIFFSEMEGYDIHSALENSKSFFVNIESAPFIWGLLILLNIFLLLYLKPILIFSKNCRRELEHTTLNRKIAIGRFNRLPLFVMMSVIILFIIRFFLDFYLYDWGEEILLFPFIYGILEAVVLGLFAGIILYLHIENILFKSKKIVFSGESDKDQKYSSFYLKLILAVAAMIFFLIFQIFDSFSSFYIMGIGGDQAGGGFFVPGEAKPDFLDLSRNHVGIREVMHVVYIRIFIFVLYGIYLLWQMRKLLQNPLNTVKLKLKGLNLDDPQLNKQIDIVNNDEFRGIYKEINLLISKQNLKLKRSEEKLEKIVENAADPIISFHSDGSIHVFNPAAEKFFGYSDKEAENLKMTDLLELPGHIRSEYKNNPQNFVNYFCNDQMVLKRFSGLHKSGKKINFESNVSHSETDHGNLYTAIIRDISGQMEFEETLKKAKSSAEKANRMKSEFLANMSHELRTPLNAVLGFTQLLSTDKNLTHGQLDKINTISRSGEHLLGLINDILDISKIESGKTEIHNKIFDLNQFVTDLKDIFMLKCRSQGLSFYVEYAGRIPPYVEGDLGKLRQVMINLIGNAVKFTSEGGISLLVGEEEGRIKFSINDTGKGIPQEDVEKILQPFIQSTNVDHEGGTGLGLAISNSFIKLMGGDLQIQSQLGTGSTFSFELPLKESQRAPVIEESRGTVISIKEGKVVKALIVDDKVNNRLILKSMLENVGFVTMEAENGLQAIERTKEFDPAIIFMDIKMPVMDGYESVQKLKDTEQGKGIVIFALTASAFSHDEKKIYESGFDGFLPKPFKMESLFRNITEKAHVEFNYKNEMPSTESINPESIELDYTVLAQRLAFGELESLADFILINDFTAIKQFAENLSQREELGNFRSLLHFYADNFNDQSLEEMLGKIRSNKND